jgi:hypothetical protein
MLVSIYVVLFVSLFILGKYLSPYLSQFIATFHKKYLGYHNPAVLSSGLGFLYLFVMFLLTLNFERLQNKETALVFKIAIIGFMLIPFNLIIYLFSRIGMYFIPATIVAYPCIFMKLNRFNNKIILLTLLLFCTVFRFFQFFNADINKNTYGTYQTIFSASQWH